MMNKIFSFLLIGILAMGTSYAIAQTTGEEAEILRMLQDRDREIRSVLGDATQLTEQQRERVRTLVNEVIDFREMGRTALGPHWDEITEPQRQEFVQVFGDIVREQSLADLDIYRAQVTYDNVTVQNGAARANTTTTYRNVTSTVAYDMMKVDGEWMITDIIIDNVSTAEGYARSFQNVVRRRGFDALMTSLNRRLERTQEATGA